MCLAGGLNHGISLVQTSLSRIAKGLSVALNVPIIGVHHMVVYPASIRYLIQASAPINPTYAQSRTKTLLSVLQSPHFRGTHNARPLNLPNDSRNNS